MGISKRLQVVAITLTMLSADAMAQSPIVDGFVRHPVTGVVESPYVLQGITYTQDQATGEFAGILYQAQDATTLYFAFEQSVHINDNSYGANAIGWPPKGHKLKDLTNSEHAKIQLYDCAGNLVLDFFLDYVSKKASTGQQVLHLGVQEAGSDGAMNFGDPAHIVGESASLEWNHQVALPQWPDRNSSSPARIPTNTYDPGTTADPNFPWIYPLVYEWAIDRAAFGANGWCGQLQITEVHNSPFKGGFNPTPVPILTVAKKANPVSGSDVSAGQEILFTIEWNNSGLSSIDDVTITDVIDPNLENIVPLDRGTYDAGTRTITWPTLASIGPGTSGSVSFLATVTPLTGDPTDLFNVAAFTSPNLPTVVETNVTEHHVVPAPDLSVAKACPGLAITGDQITYTLTIDNLGSVDATGVVVADVLPPEVSFASASPSPDSVVGNTLTWQLGTVASGATVVITVNADVDALAGSATNNVSVTGNESEDPTNNSATCLTEIFSPDVFVSKGCPTDVTGGEQATYNIVAGNSGTSPAANVIVTDTLPAGVTFVSATPSPSSVVGDTVTIDLGDLGAGATTNITIVVDVDVTSGTLTNVVSVATDTPEGGDGPTNNSDTCASTVQAADLSVTKSCPAELVAGEAGVYTITVSNTGGASALDVILTDTLPAGVTFLGGTPSATTIAGPTITWDLGTIAAGGSVNVVVDVTGVSTSGSQANNVSVTTSSLEGGAGPSNNADGCASTAVAPDVSIAKTCPVDMVTDEPATYTLTVANEGTSTAKSVTVTDTLPAQVSFVSATPPPTSIVGQTLSWDLGDIGVSGGTVITITVNPDASSGIATNGASVSTSSDEGGAGSANNADSCDSPIKSPDIAVTTACPVDMIAGEAASYTVTVENLGTSTAKGVVLTDVLPAGVTFDTASVAPGSAVGQTLTWNLGDLAAGATVTITINLTANATAGIGTNNASATTTSTEGGAAATNNADSCASNFLAPDVSIDKVCPVDMIAGEAASYTVTVDNLGTSTAKGVVLTDVLPAGVSFDSASTAPDAIVGQTLTWNLGDILAGASLTITINVTPNATSGVGTNSASVTTPSTEGGAGATNNADSCASNFLAPDVSIAKTCPIDMVTDEPATYTLTISNGGTSAAKSVSATDTLPPTVSFLSATPPPNTVVGQTLTWDLGDMAVGATTVITITVNPDATSGTSTNPAAVSTTSQEGGAGSADNADSCDSTFKAPDIAVTTACPVDMIAGEAASYTVTVDNLGTSTAKGVVLTDVLPAGITFDSASTAPDSIVGQTLAWNLGDLAAGATVTITLNVTPNATTGIGTNSASATTTSTEGGAVATNNSDSCSSNFLAPDVSIAKTCPIDMVTDEPAAYTLTVSNEGTSTAKSVTVTDVLPATVSFVSATPAPTSIVGQTLTWDLGDLAVGASTAITITVNPDATNGTATNGASVTTTSQEGGAGSANNADSCDSTFKSPDIAVATVCPVDMIAGEAASYTVTIDNPGTSTAKGVVLTDVLPAGVTFDSASTAPDAIVGQALTWTLGDLAAGATVTITINVTPNATTGIGTNSASATTTSSEGGAGATNNADSCASNFLAPDVAIDKTCPVDMITDEPAAYTLTASNIGTSTAKSVTVTDTLPATVSFVSATPAPTTIVGQTLTWDLGDLAVGASTAITIAVNPDAPSGTSTNGASITTTSQEGGAGSVNNADSCDSTFKSPDIAVATVCPVDLIAGEAASYTVTVDNLGTSTANAVFLTDVLPSGVTFDSSSTTPDTIVGQTLTWSLGDLAAGASVTITINVTPNATIGIGTNSASATTTSTEGGAAATNNADSCASNFLAPDVSIAKTCPIDMITDEPATYTVTAANEGTSTAKSVSVTDTLPSTVTFVSASPAPTSVVGQTLTWNLGDLAVGASTVITITVNPDATNGTGTNTTAVSTTSQEGGAGSSNNADTCDSTFKSPDIAVTTVCPVDMIAGEAASYTVTVDNLGTSTAKGTILTNVLPAGVAFDGASTAPDGLVGQTLTWSLGDLAAGAQVTITINVTANATTGIGTNSASATTTSTEGGAAATNNADSCGSSFLAPDVSVAKTCPVDMITDEPAAYSLTVSNDGTSTAKSVTLTDTLPATVSYLSATPAPTTVVGQTLTWDLGDLAVGASTVITITVNPDATSGTSTNAASVSTTSQEGGAGSANNADSCDSTFKSPDIAVTTVCPVDMIAGEATSYTVTVDNLGTSTAKGIVLTNVLPDGVTFDGASTAPDTIVGQTLTWNVGHLAVGASVTITINVTPNSTAGIGTNAASATTTSTEGGAGATNNADSCASNFLAPDVSIGKVCPVDMIQDEPATYTLTVSNEGTSTAKSVVVTDTLPSTVSFVSATPAPTTIDGQVLTWDLGDLAVGATTVITITVNPDSTSGTSTNAAAAITTSQEGGQGAVNNSSSCQSNFKGPDIAVATVCPVDMIAGEPASYTVTVDNLGTSIGKDVVLNDVLPAGVTFDSASTAPDTIAGQTLTWNLGDLPAGGSVTIILNVTPNATSGIGTNAVSATSTSTEGGAGATNNADSCGSNFLAPDVSIAKTCPIDMVTDEPATYTLTMANLGTSTAKSVTVTDTLPAAVSYVSASPAPTTIVGQTLTWDIGDLAVGATAVITITVNPESASGTATNGASVSTTSQEGGAGSANNADSCDSTFKAPDIAVSTSCPADMIAGETASYSVTVDNLGTSTAKGVVLTDVLPAGVTFDSASTAPDTIAAQTLTWNLGDIAVGGSVTIVIDVTPNATTGIGTNSASATTTSTEGGAVATNNAGSCASNFLAPDVSIVKTCPIDMVTDEPASYTLTVSNDGTSAAKSVTVTDTLPATVSFVSATLTPASVVGQTLTWNLGDLAVGASTTITITANPDATSGTSTNGAGVSTISQEGGAGSANNADSCDSTFKAPDIAVTTACPVDMVAGEPASYTVTVENVGSSVAKGVVLTDALPDGVTFDSASTAPDTIAGQTLTWNLADIAAGGSVTITIDVTPNDTTGIGTNSASATTTSTEGGAAATNNTDSCGSNFLAPDISIAKTCPVDMITDEPATYTLQVSNDGTSPAKSVVVTDTLPATVSFVSATPAPTTIVGQTLTWNLGDIGVSGASTITIAVNPDATAGTATNGASVSTTSQEGGSGAANNADSCDSTFKAPDIAVTTVCPTDMTAGEPASYTVTVDNLGTSTAKGVVLTDVLPAGVAFGSALPAPDSTVGQTLTWSLGDIAAGGSVTISINVTANATSGIGTNSASATTTSTEGGAEATNNSDSCGATFLAPDVSIAKTCPVDMITDEPAAYTLTVSNDGTSTADAVTVIDTLPATVSFVSATPAPSSIVGQTLTWDLGDLGVGASSVITITVNPDATSGTSTNGASVSTTSQEGGSGAANNADSCDSTFKAPDLAVTTVCPVDMIAGEPASYTVTVENLGTSTAKGVVLTDVLPGGVSFESASVAPNSIAAQALNWNLGDLAAGASVTITINVTPNATTGIGTNSASATTTSTEGGAATANNADSCGSNFLAPDLAIAKICPVDMITDEPAVYTVTVSNEGTSTAKSVTVTDTLPATVSYVSATPAPASVVGQVLTWDLGDLAVGASTVITITVNPDATSGTSTNAAAAITTSQEGGQGSANNSTSCDSTFKGPDIAVATTCPVDMIAGEPASYTVTVDNVGTATAKGVVLTDALPAGVTFDSASTAPDTVVGQTLTWNLGDIAAGGSVTITINVTPTATSGLGTNSVSATTTSTEGGAAASNNANTCASNFLAPDIQVQKSCPADLIAGTQGTYTVTIANVGTSPAKGLTAGDVLPDEVAFVSATPSPTSAVGQSLSWNLADLPAGASTTITIVVDVTAVSGTATNTATAATTSVEGGSGAANNANACDSDVLSANVFLDAACAPSTVNANGSYAFQVDFGNTGTAAAHEVVLTDNVPAGFFQGDAFTATATQGVVAVVGNTVTVTLGTLAPGATGSLTIAGTVTASTAAAGPHDNGASIVTSSTQSNAANDAGSCTVTVTAPELALTKTSVVAQVTRSVTNLSVASAVEIVETVSASVTDTVVEASRITYTLTVSNVGTGVASDVTIVDTLPTGVTIIANPDGGAISGGTVTWSLGSLPPSGSATATLTVETD